MAAPATVEQFLDLLRKSELIDAARLASYLTDLQETGRLPAAPQSLAQALIAEGLLTHFQAEQLLQGKARGFVLNGKYLLLEHLGSGGMGQVYLCQHTSMHRKVAIKVLPLAKAKDPSYLERFYREARAAAALDHPNIVRAYDIDHDGRLHFLVMEYVDGSSLQEIVKLGGPLVVERAAHYMSQAAWGLQHAHEAGVVHRDIKPGNILVDRNGLVKILDMGLARFFDHRSDNLSHRYDETVLGTTDYLAPEQSLNSSSVDIRADVYSLGATFYYCLTGQTIFGEGATAQKLIWHQIRQPRPLRSLRPDVPEAMEAIVHRMLAKEPGERFQLPAQVAEALLPWTQTPIPPPPVSEMPRLSPALRNGQATFVVGGTSPPTMRNGGAHGTPMPVASSLENCNATPTRVSLRSPPTPRPLSSALDTERPSGQTPRIQSDPDQTGEVAIADNTDGLMGERADPVPATGVPRKTMALSVAHRHLWLLAGVALVLVTVAGLAGGAAFWALSRAPQTETPPPGGGEPAGLPPTAASPRVSRPSLKGVVVLAEAEAHRIEAARYEATVERDGCLTSLRADGVEFLRPGIEVSRGLYLYQDGVGTFALPTVEQPAPTQLVARGEQGSIQYEFFPDRLRCTGTNHTDQPVSLYIVLSTAVRSAANDSGETAEVPARRSWKEVTWYAGAVKLMTKGSDQVWPWYENSQVIQTVLPPHESRRIELQVGSTAADLKHMAGHPQGLPAHSAPE